MIVLESERESTLVILFKKDGEMKIFQSKLKCMSCIIGFLEASIREKDEVLKALIAT